MNNLENVTRQITHLLLFASSCFATIVVCLSQSQLNYCSRCRADLCLTHFVLEFISVYNYNVLYLICHPAIHTIHEPFCLPEIVITVPREANNLGTTQSVETYNLAYEKTFNFAKKANIANLHDLLGCACFCILLH